MWCIGGGEDRVCEKGRSNVIGAKGVGSGVLREGKGGCVRGVECCWSCRVLCREGREG